MRHRDSGRKLNRNASHRRAMLRNMTSSLVAHELIRTTVVKAKELRRFAEPLITMAANDTVANRRRLFSKLRNHDAVGKLFTDLGPRYKERPGGYLRILKDGYRDGDKAPMSVVELVARPEQVDDVVRAREARFAALTQESTSDASKAATKKKQDAVKEKPASQTSKARPAKPA